VQPDGIDLKMLMFAAGREIFDRMVGAREFDLAELKRRLSEIAGRGCLFEFLAGFGTARIDQQHVLVLVRGLGQATRSD